MYDDDDDYATMILTHQPPFGIQRWIQTRRNPIAEPTPVGYSVAERQLDDDSANRDDGWW